VKYEASFDPYRPTGQHGVLRRLGIRVLDLELFEKLAQFEGGRSIDDDAHRTLVIMFANERDRGSEIRIGHAWHGNEQLVC
jgi:hypothetical protein